MNNPFDLIGMITGTPTAQSMNLLPNEEDLIGDMKTPFDMSTQVASAEGGGQGTLRGLIERLLPQRQQQAPSLPNIEPTQTQNPLAPDASRTPVDMDRSGVGHPAADTLSPVQKAFLNATSSGESGGKYNVRYSPRGPVTVADMSKHPGIMEAGPAGPSSAAGRYQITKSTWNSIGGGPFDPVTQDIRAWQIADRDYYAKTRRDLKTDLEMEGFSPKIARALSGTWVSFKTGYRKNRDVFNKSLEQYTPTEKQQNFETKLTPQEENKYQQWKKLNAPNDSGADYDLRGAFKAGIMPAQNGHWPDTFKKPNHPTFSNESVYAPYGNPGKWEGNKFIPNTKNISDPNGNPVRQILEKHQPMLNELIKNGPIKIAGHMDSISRYGQPNIRGDKPTKDKLKRLERQMEKDQIENDVNTDEDISLASERPPIQKVGDVVPLPIVPGPNAGPTNKAADYGYGLKGEPGVVSIGVPTMSDWLRRAGERYRNK